MSCYSFSIRTVVGCDPLTLDSSVTISPPSCTASDKVHAGTVCTLHCDRDGELSSDLSTITCLESGRWTEEEEDISSLRCVGKKLSTKTNGTLSTNLYFEPRVLFTFLARFADMVNINCPLTLMYLSKRMSYPWIQ